MTIAVAWVRRTKRGAGQLVLASDSRLQGAGALDASPKVFRLPRSDALLGFAGDAYFAYPFLLQIIEAVEAHGPLRSRAMNYSKFRTHMLRLLNGLAGSFTPVIPSLSTPETSFVLCGFDWFEQEWEIDSLHYSTGEKRFVNHSVASGPGHLGKILWAGDQASVGRKLLRKLMVKKHGLAVLQKKNEQPARFDWEPFEIVRDMLRDPDRSSTIGGPPQVAAVAQHLNSTYYGVEWPLDGSPIYLRGRLLLPYERVDNWHLAPDSLSLKPPLVPELTPERAARLAN